MDDLETNPLYRAFLSKFKRQFDIACKMSYLIAIPHSDSLDDVTIDQFFANSHILMPSRLLKMHYTPLQANQTEIIEEIDDGNKLILYLGNKKNRNVGKIIVNVLAQEIGYNVNNREFKTLLIDKPLMDPNLLTRPLLMSIFLSPLSSPKFNRQGSGRRALSKPPKPLTNHDNCYKYLESISQQITMELESEIKRLQTRYMILSQYLEDAAMRIRNLANKFVPKYLSELSSGGYSSGRATNITNTYNANKLSYIICDSSRNSICLAVENYIVYLLHGKLIASLYQEYEREEIILMKKFDLIQKQRLTICQLGAQKAFSDFLLTDEIKQEFRLLSSLQSPLAMVSSLMKIVNLITESLNQSVRFQDQFGLQAAVAGPSSRLENRISICSDDLIASFVYSIAHAKPPYLYSTSKYLETFGFSSNAKEQAAYYTATFQIVIQYILSFVPEQQSQQKLSERQIDRSKLETRVAKLSNFEPDYDETLLLGAATKVVVRIPQASNKHQTFASDSLDSREST